MYVITPSNNTGTQAGLKTQANQNEKSIRSWAVYIIFQIDNRSKDTHTLDIVLADAHETITYLECIICNYTQ